MFVSRSQFLRLSVSDGTTEMTGFQVWTHFQWSAKCASTQPTQWPPSCASRGRYGWPSSPRERLSRTPERADSRVRLQWRRSTTVCATTASASGWEPPTTAWSPNRVKCLYRVIDIALDVRQHLRWPLLSLSGGYYDKDQGLTEFLITGLAFDDGTYMKKYYSMGFSVDTSMGDDLTTDCYVTSEGKVKLGSSVNLGKDNEKNDEWKDSLHSIETSVVNGLVRCKWRSPRNRSVGDRQWDFLEKKYHIFLAMGEITDDTGNKGYHSEHKVRTDQPINLELMGAVITTDPIYLVRIHGMSHSRLDITFPFLTVICGFVFRTAIISLINE